MPNVASPPDLPADAYDETCDFIRLIGVGGGAAAGVEPCRTPDRLFWFRWITGHQVCFIVWRLMAHVMDDLAGGKLAPETALRLVCDYIRAYCVMLLYTGSCPRAAYHSLIRPSMQLRHPSFSGSWAPDYWPVRDLFRARRLPRAWVPDQAELQRAIKLHQLVHDGVAARLVPDGRSLLRQSTARVRNIGLLNVIYDNYFMTLRAPVSQHDLVAQLLRRLIAISQDVAVNGLYPEGEGMSDPPEDLDERPEELLTPEVAGCEDDFVEILWQVAVHASGRTGAGLAPAELPSG